MHSWDDASLGLGRARKVEEMPNVGEEDLGVKVIVFVKAEV
jgi:hypothetical protein